MFMFPLLHNTDASYDLPYKAYIQIQSLAIWSLLSTIGVFNIYVGSPLSPDGHWHQDTAVFG